MKAKAAARLARRCRDDVRGEKARRAWERLVSAGDRGDQAATDEVWRLWLDEPLGRAWKALLRWRRPATGDLYGPSRVALGDAESGDAVLRAALVDAAMRMDHPIGETARNRVLAEREQSLIDEVCTRASTNDTVAAFCVEHGLAPADPVRQAAFFLLTGQAEQYRAVDPDGSLLTTGYTAATEKEREHLRAAMVRAGGLDVIRVVARGGDLKSRAEIDYLTGELAGRGEWDELWRLVQNLPLVHAVAAIPHFAQEWRPADDQGRALFNRLATTSRGAIIRACHAAYTSTRDTVRVEMPGTVIAGSFSPEGHRLVVATRTSSRSSVVAGKTAFTTYSHSGGLRVFELPQGTLVEQYVYEDAFPRCVVHLDEGFVAGWWNPDGLDRYSNGARETLAGFPGPIAALVPYGDGFAALQVSRQPKLESGGIGDDRLIFADASGQVVHDISLPSDLPGGDTPALAAEPGTGRLAVGGDDLRVLSPFAESVLARSPAPVASDSVCFLGPDRLAVGHSSLGLWHLQDERLIRRASADAEHGSVGDLVAIPRRAEIAAVEHASGRVRYFDAENLATVELARKFVDSAGTALWSSPGGDYLALGGHGFVDVVPIRHPITWADRPLAQATPADLTAVTSALNDRHLPPGVRPLLELVRDCLRHRFGSELHLGTGTLGNGDDITLSRGDE